MLTIPGRKNNCPPEGAVTTAESRSGPPAALLKLRVAAEAEVALRASPTFAMSVAPAASPVVIH